MECTYFLSQEKELGHCLPKDTKMFLPHQSLLKVRYSGAIEVDQDYRAYIEKLEK